MENQGLNVNNQYDLNEEEQNFNTRLNNNNENMDNFNTDL